jgi:hypothetical protein
MKRVQWIGTLVVVVAAVSGQAMAQDSAWDWQFTPYLWGAAIDGDVAIGPIGREVDVEFSEIVDVLSGAALFRVEGGNDDHGFITDFVWLRLEPEDEIATVGGVAAAEFDTVMADVGYVRKLDRIDLELGARYWDFELELDPALLPEIVRDDNWVDGYVGIRLVREIGSNWLWQTRLNVGAGGSDSTFGAETHFALRFDNDNALVVGFKALDVDYSNDSVGGTPFVIDTMFLGGTIGFMFD